MQTPANASAHGDRKISLDFRETANDSQPTHGSATTEVIEQRDTRARTEQRLAPDLHSDIAKRRQSARKQRKSLDEFPCGFWRCLVGGVERATLLVSVPRGPVDSARSEPRFMCAVISDTAPAGSVVRLDRKRAERGRLKFELATCEHDATRRKDNKEDKSARAIGEERRR